MNAWKSLAALLLLTLSRAGAAPAPADDTMVAEETRAMAAVEVAALLPGPSLWRVSHGDHEMWILGTISPVPKRMQWDSTDVAAVIADSQLVLGGPSVNVTSEVGFFGKLALIPKLLAARRNPGKEMLREVLPAATYARWQKLAARHFGSTRSLEKQRPILVAGKLYQEALDENGLRPDSGVSSIVAKAAKRSHVDMQYPRLKVVVPDMKALLADFSKTTLDDIACLEQTMTYVENDIPAMRVRANAWANGDIDTLRTLKFTESYDACVSSLFAAPGLAKHGFENLRERMRATWLEAAESALKTHRTTFAVLPISQLLSADGYVAELGKRGYTVEAPGEAAPDLPADVGTEAATP